METEDETFTEDFPLQFDLFGFVRTLTSGAERLNRLVYRCIAAFVFQVKIRVEMEQFFQTIEISLRDRAMARTRTVSGTPPRIDACRRHFTFGLDCPGD